MSKHAIHRFVRRGMVLAAAALTLLAATSPASSQTQPAFAVDFPANAPTSYQLGSGRNIPLQITGTPPAGTSVMVTAMEVKTRRVVNSFTTVLRSGPWRIPAASMNKLPAGEVVITVETLKPSRKVRHRMTILAPVVTRETTVAPDATVAATTQTLQATTTSTAISFANPPSSYVRGSGATIGFNVASMPAGGDVLILAWSDAQQRMVDAFAHTRTASPWRIDNSKLDALPDGDVVLQLLVRVNNKPTAKIEHRLAVQAPGTTALPNVTFPSSFPASYLRGSGATLTFEVDKTLPANVDILALAWSGAEGRMVDAFAHAHKGSPWRIDNDKLDQLPAGEATVQLLLRVDNKVVSKVERPLTVQTQAVPVAPGVAFASGFPATYVKGSGATLAFDVTGTFPTGGDVLVLAWSDAQQRMVDTFAHTRAGSPWRIDNGKLDTLPDGDAYVQLVLRQNNRQIAKAERKLVVQSPASQTPPDTGGDDGVVTPPPTTEPTPGDGTIKPPPDSSGPTDPTPVTPFAVKFSSASPSQYTINSTAKFALDVTGTLPTGADVLVLCWSHATSSMRDDVAHALAAEPWELKNANLNRIPVGMAELQLAYRQGDQFSIMARKTIVVEPDPTAPPPVDEPTTPTDPTVPTPGELKWVEPIVRLPSGGDLKKLLDEQPTRKAMTIVLAAGGTYNLSGTINWRTSGESADRPIILTVEPGGDRARIRTNGKNAINFASGVSNVRFAGIHLHANRRDPDDSSFNGGGTYENAINISGPASNIDFEDCELSYFTFGMVIDDWQDHGGTARIRNISFRRCIIRDSYSFGGDHSSGLFITEVDGLLIDGCIFDHNGWSERVSSSKRIGFNHNIYLMNCRNVIVRNSIFARESFLSLKVRSGQWADGANGKTQNLLIQDNLFLETLLPLGINDNIASGDVTAEDVQVIGNVILRTGGMLQGTPMGVGMSIMKIARLKLDRNIFTDKGVADGSLLVKPAVEIKQATTLRDIQIRGNVVKWPAINYYTGKPIQLISREAGQAFTSSQVTLSGNLINAPDSRFVNAKRDFAGYAKSVGLDGSVHGFMLKATRQKPWKWDGRYTAAGVNKWIRDGFELIPFD